MIVHRGFRPAALALAAALTLALGHGATARAQYTYPGGYGGYGWRGWGGGATTAAGANARGLGAFAAGAGSYNVNTAQANAINTDTAMQWNEYVYQGTVAAAQRHHARMAKMQYNDELAREKVYARLRDNPTPRDVYTGDALNVIKDEINNPRIYARTLKAASAKIPGETVRDIPFEHASEMVIASVHDLTTGEVPEILKNPRFDPERADLKKIAAQTRKEVEEGGKPKPADLAKIRDLVGDAREKLEAQVPKDAPGYAAAENYLKAVAGLTRMLESPAMNVILSGVEKRPEVSLGEVLQFMNAYNLQFGPVTTPEGRLLYDGLYAKLMDVRKEIAPDLAGVAPPGFVRSPAPASQFFAGMNAKDVEEVPPPPPPPAAK